MKRKSLIILSLILVLALLLVGCGPKSPPKEKPDPPSPVVTDEAKIRSQMAKWAEAWKTRDTNNFRTTMVETKIGFTYTGEIELTELTIDEFIGVAEVFEFWGFLTSSRVNINSIAIDGKSASLKGEWIIGYDRGGMIFAVEASLLEDNDQWLISSLVITFSRNYYEGEENEEYDEKRHTSYISFYVDGERYIFHDQYGGNDPEMASLDPGILFAITAYKADSEVGLSLYFSLEGDNPEFDFGACYNEAGDRYETETPGFIDSMEADFVNGSVHGTFFGEMESEDGDIVEITDGEFHFNHEFNCPEVTIESPGEGDVISGLITISGTWYDESELSHIWVSVDSRGTGETVDEGLATIGSYTWTSPFDSNKVENGEYKITVYATDKYWATSEEVESTMIVNN